MDDCGMSVKFAPLSKAHSTNFTLIPQSSTWSSHTVIYIFSEYIRRKRSNFKQRNFYFPQFISKWNRKTETVTKIFFRHCFHETTISIGHTQFTVVVAVSTYVFKKIVNYCMSSESWVPQARLVCTTRCARGAIHQTCCQISHFRCLFLLRPM